MPTSTPSRSLRCPITFHLVALLLVASAAVAAAGTAITEITVGRAVASQFVTFAGATANVLTFSPDSRLLACGLSDGRVMLYDVQSGSQVVSLLSHEAPVSALSFLPTGGLIASSDLAGRLVVWELASGTAVKQWELGAAIHDASFSPQGSFLLCVGGMRDVVWWETDSWTRMPPIAGHSSTVYSLAVSVEEDLLVTGAGDGDPSVRVWSLPDGGFLREDLYEGRVHDIEFSPSERAARYPITCIAGTQLTVWFWEVERGDYWHLMGYFRTPVRDIAYSSRGNAVIAASEGGNSASGGDWPKERLPPMIRVGGVDSGQEQRARVRTQPSGVPHGDRGSRQAPGASHADGGR